MWLIIYMPAASIVAALVFLSTGNEPAAQLAVIGWMVFTFLCLLVRGRTVPERWLLIGNDVFFVLAVLFTVAKGR